MAAARISQSSSGVALEQVRAVALPILASHGLDLVDIEWKRGPRGRILQVMIERVDPHADATATPGGEAQDYVAGVNLDD